MVHHEKTEARERILQAAMSQFAEHGFAATSVRQICDAAGVNVAAVNYYFRSKEQLYHEVFKVLFEDISAPMMAIPKKVRDAATWRVALLEWITMALETITAGHPPKSWMVKLIAYERTNPSSVFPVLHENFFQPLRESLARLIHMGLPKDTDMLTASIWEVSVASQVLVFMHRSPPWDEMLIPKGTTREDWIDRTAHHIEEGISARLSFRGRQ